MNVAPVERLPLKVSFGDLGIIMLTHDNNQQTLKLHDAENMVEIKRAML